MRFEPDKHLHSREHLLADDLTKMLGEPRKFAAYLGIAKLYYESDLRALAKYVLAKENLPADARGKYFFAALKNLPKMPGIKLKRKRKPPPLKLRRAEESEMAKITPIVKEPDKILRKNAVEVPIKEITTPKIQGLILSMKETLKNTPDGVGLAAPQVGHSLRIFIVSEESYEIDKAKKKAREEQKSSPPREWKYFVFINPAVRNISRKKIADSEGCLSVPGKYGVVRRHEKITVEARDEHGKKILRGASGFFARVMQHELDHLQGILFIDKAEQMLAPIVHEEK